MDRRLERFLQNDHAISQYAQARDLLKACGVLDILRRKAIPTLFENGKDVQIAAAQGHYAAGAQAALDQLEYFLEMNNGMKPVSQVTPDFNGKASALAQGLITPKDLEGIKK